MSFYPSKNPTLKSIILMAVGLPELFELNIKQRDDYLLFRDPALNRWVINFMISFAIDSIGLPVTLITKKLPFLKY